MKIYTKLWTYKSFKIIMATIVIVVVYNIYSIIDYKISRMILEDVKLESQKDSLTIKLKEMMQDSVFKWHKNKRQFFESYNTSENWYWEDIIVFNNEKTKAFSFVYQMNKSKSKITCDAVQYYLAFKKKNGIWYFYTDTPTLGFCRSGDYFQPPYTIEKMQDFMYKDLAKYVNIFEGSIDCKIVDEWFESEGDGNVLRNAMKEK